MAAKTSPDPVRAETEGQWEYRDASATLRAPSRAGSGAQRSDANWDAARTGSGGVSRTVFVDDGVSMTGKTPPDPSLAIPA